jgi:phospholipase C
VYAALRGGPQWMRSLYVVTFDEHGGYFDHATPAAAVNPDGINSPAPGDEASFAPQFSFDRLGLRVPTVLASPYLGKGIVSSLPLQHTSVLATVRKLFGVSGSLTRRDAAAPSFETLFLPAPRSDTPAALIPPSAELPAGFDATRAAPDDVMSEMARDWRKVTGTLPGARPSPVPISQDQTHQFLRSQIQAFLDYRARTARSRRRRKAR